MKFKSLLLLLSVFFACTFNGIAQDHAVENNEHEAVDGDEHVETEFEMAEMIMHHVLDDHSWEFAHGAKIPLPVILYSKEKGLDVFMSSKFDHGNYNGYEMHHNKIALADDHHAKVWDFSITKNVASLILSAIILFLIFTAVARGYKKNAGKAPSGIQSFFEPVITTVKEVVQENIGPKYERFLPYMLTLFFFILINNLMGLTPGAANLTGNIAITLTLALITFIMVHVNAKVPYWKHIVAPPGVPGWLKPLFWIIEVIGVFVKPASLTIRLFANITGGHIIILCLIGLIFLFKNWFVGGGVVVLSTFMSGVEILVAFIQAYIFTLLSSMYIGSALDEGHDH